jgi:hypothetical protein
LPKSPDATATTLRWMAPAKSCRFAAFAGSRRQPNCALPH